MLLTQFHSYWIFLSIFILILVQCSPTRSLDVDECEPGLQKPISVNVVDCDKQPCQFKRRTKVLMTMEFKAPELIKSNLRAKVVANVDGTSVPFPLPQPNACLGLINTHCPLEENELAIYKLEMPILILYPKITLGLKFSLEYNNNPKELTCFQIQAQIV